MTRSHATVARRFTITLANQGGQAFEVTGNEPLLDTLEEHGVSLPFGCRYGGCISCAAKLLDGEVDQSEGVALNGRQIGMATCCCALPIRKATVRSTWVSRVMTSSTAIRSRAPLGPIPFTLV